MQDKFIQLLLANLGNISFPITITSKDDKSKSQDITVVSVEHLQNLISQLETAIKAEEIAKMPKTRFLCVEDGSVDFDKLEQELAISNPEIKLIKIKPGSAPVYGIKNID